MSCSHPKQSRQEVAAPAPTTTEIPSPPDSPILGVVSPSPGVEPQVTVDASLKKAPAPIIKSAKQKGPAVQITSLSTLSASIQATLMADLLDDPLLVLEKLKTLQDSLKSCYQITRLECLC